MKVLIINARLNHGGVETQIKYTVSGLARYGHEVTVVTYAEPYEWNIEDGVSVRYIPWRFGVKKNYLKIVTFAGFMVRLLRFCRKNRFDLIHTYGPFENLMGFLVSTIQGTPFIASVRTNKEWAFKFTSIWKNRAAFVLTNSRDIKRILRERYDIPEEKIEVIRNGIDIDRFPFFSNGSPENGVKTFTVIGRISPSKNQLFFVRALFEFIRNNGDDPAEFKLVFVGRIEDHGYNREISRYLQEAGLAENTESYDWSEDVLPFYRNTDYIALPSRTEGLPNVLIEAMAAGVPWIASDVADIPFLAGENEERGFLFEDNSESSCIAALQRLEDADDKTIESMCRRGRTFVETDFSLEALIRNTDRLYRRAVS